MTDNRGKRLPTFDNRTGGEVLRQAHEQALELVRRLAMVDFDPLKIESIVADGMQKPSALVLAALTYIAEFLVPNIRRCSDEIDACLNGFAGQFVPPGPSGAPTPRPGRHPAHRP